MKLLCVSEDENLGARVSAEASRSHWQASVINDRKNVTSAIEAYGPDVVVVEIANAPDLQWWKQCSHADSKPVLFLHQEQSEDFLISALESGADGLLPKDQFSSRFFEAKVNALLRRREKRQSVYLIQRLGLLIDNDRCQAEVRGKSLPLTLTEFKLLRELAFEDGRTVSRQLIHSKVLGGNLPNNRSLDVHICSLRKKVAEFGLSVDSVRGIGYRLNLVDEARK